MGLIVKSNLCSIQSDGETVTDDFCAAIDYVYGNVIIGGNADEGNLFAVGLQIDVSRTNQISAIGVSSNTFCIDHAQKNVFTGVSLQIKAGQNVVSTNSIVTVRDNILCGAENNTIGLNFTRLDGTVNVIRNYINIDKDKNQLGSLTFGIYVQLCKDVHIGSNDINDANYIGYCEPIFAENAGNLTFTKNSFFCVTSNYVYFDQAGQQRPVCNTTKITTNSVSGVSNPNALVDLYYTDHCNTCAAQTYFASVNADASGNWTYNGAISGTVVANATYNKMSSDFTFTRINTDNLKVNSACGGPGSITGIQVFGGTNIKWVDANGNIVGTDVDLLNLQPGKYKLIVDNGGCNASTGYFTILAKFTLDGSNAVKINPACGSPLGSITGLNIVNSDNGQIDYSWTDANRKVWGNALQLRNVPAGSYFITATGKDTCVQTYGPVVLEDGNRILPPPSTNNVILCSPGVAFLNINNPVAGNSYRLYDSNVSTTVLDENKDGHFQINVIADRSFYISQAFYNCESSRTQVLVYTGLTASSVPNAITPNGDGINDFWNIKGIDKYPNAMVQIFSRAGQKVFESKGYPQPFDGSFNGRELPEGVYYYIIKLMASCNVSGNLTIIR